MTAPQTDPAGTLILASNRLPVNLRLRGEELTFTASSGGLVSALRGLQGGQEFSWVGWPGLPIPKRLHGKARDLLGEQGLSPVFLTAREENQYYQQVGNQVLWPLFHYFPEKVEFSGEAWKCYREVNERFAAVIAESAPPGGRVWVHDFHLMLLPGLLREARPDLQIGFFLHIPFPSSETYRVLPPREEVLGGLLGADYIGFHTSDYSRHFRSTCLRVLGLDTDPHSVYYQGRQIDYGVHPIGIDLEGFRSALADPESARIYNEVKARYQGRKLILSLERLDYTKGIDLKLTAFERFLEREPERAKHVTFLQVIIPSRLANPDYQQLKSSLEEQIGRINGKYSGPGWTPVEYMYRTVPPQELVALYRLADIGMVTPVRDGMNLVAQEFVYCQGEERLPDTFRGVLILSEFAGAAHYLTRSILVNPWNIEPTADRIESALRMDPQEREARMAWMRKRVVDMEGTRWSTRFLEKLHEVHERHKSQRSPNRLTPDDEGGLRRRSRAAPAQILFLDYDGTLREIERLPEEAEPTPEILTLLEGLALLDTTETHIVSGRRWTALERWFGHLPLHLCAEHGCWAKKPGQEWSRRRDVDLSWKPLVEEVLSQMVEEVPGSRLERKDSSLAWHYRMADPDYGVWRARELMSDLEGKLAQEAADVLPGHRVIEVRSARVNKGAYVSEILAEAPKDRFVLYAGDDRTDEEAYRVVPPSAVTIHVGSTAAQTNYSVASPRELRQLLRRLFLTEEPE